MPENRSVRHGLASFPPAIIAVFFIILIFSILRIKFYGNPSLSIAGNDTITYVEASRAPFFSAEIFTGRRLLTTNLFYKIFEPQTGYEIAVNGSIDTTNRAYQPGFDKIVIVQLILSLLGWGLLAWFIAETIHNPWLKVLSTILILAFAYTPQMADWDSILMSESLTFSLFALQLAFMIKIGTMLQKNGNAKISKWALAWGVTFFFWAFLKDTNLFTALTTAGMIVILFRSPAYRKNKQLVNILIFLAIIFVLGFYTASQSSRSLAQLKNLYRDDLLISQNRIDILQEMGMPAVTSRDDVNNPDFEAWIMDKGSSTLARFMITHPGYPIIKLLTDFSPAFTEIGQTYFYAKELNPARQILFEVGNALHPENTTPFLANLILLMGLILVSRKGIANSSFWAWLGLWLFLSASFAFIPTILGDTWALNRHALYSTMVFRFSMWILPVVLTDLALHSVNPNSSDT